MSQPGTGTSLFWLLGFLAISASCTDGDATRSSPASQPRGTGELQMLPHSVSAVEAQATNYPVPADDLDFPEAYLRNPVGAEPRQVPGTPERRCVEITTEGMTRSGEFIVGGYLPDARTGRITKIWWKPLVLVPGMSLQVRAARLGIQGDTARFRTDYATPPTGRPVDETFFPWGVQFNEPGEWILVGTSNENWGCFIISVEAN